jgi:hypothetical protein
MVRNRRPVRRTVLIGMGAVGASMLAPWTGQVRAEDGPKPMPGERAVPRDDAAKPLRAVLYEEDAADGRRFAGTVRWSAGREREGTGTAAEMVLRAKVVIPDRGITLRWAMRRNTDKSLPATHTVELIFALPPAFQHGGIENVPGMLLKTDETARGTPVKGLAVKVTRGYFLIGLSAVEAESRSNMLLLKERSWLDLPIVYTDKRRAILAIEKGRPGERAFAEAFAAWDRETRNREDDRVIQ